MQAGVQVENEPDTYKGKRETTPILGSFAAPAGLCPSLLDRGYVEGRSVVSSQEEPAGQTL